MKNLKKISRKQLKKVFAGTASQEELLPKDWTPCATGCKEWEICCGEYNGFTYCNNGPCPR